MRPATDVINRNTKIAAEEKVGLLAHESTDHSKHMRITDSLARHSISQQIKRLVKSVVFIIVFLSLLWLFSKQYPTAFLPKVCPIDHSVDQSNVSDVYEKLAVKHFGRLGVDKLADRSISSDDISLVYTSYRNVARFRWYNSKLDRFCLLKWCSAVRVKYVDLEGIEHSQMPSSLPAHAVSRVRSMWAMMQQFVDMWDSDDLPEYMDILMNISDYDEYHPVDDRVPLPILFSSTTNPNDRSIPFVYFISWYTLFEKMDEYVRTVLSRRRGSIFSYFSCVAITAPSIDEWNELKHMAYWRGSTTGGSWTIPTYTSFPRFQLANISRAHPSLIDARLTSCTQCEPKKALESALKADLGDYFGTRMSDFDDLLPYKGLIDVDGNSWSSRTPQLLATGAVVFKQRSPFYEFWSELVLEDVHYISFNSDLSDLVQRVTNVLSQPESREMGARGQQFVHQYLTQSSVYLYAQHILRLYERKLKQPSVAETHQKSYRDQLNTMVD